MKLIDELLGFAVLTGPLWLMLILLPVSTPKEWTAGHSPQNQQQL